jgi:hypothetical protein
VKEYVVQPLVFDFLFLCATNFKNLAGTKSNNEVNNGQVYRLRLKVCDQHI